jgi:signal peptidase I
MHINFPLILVIATCVSGLIVLLDRLFWAKPRVIKGQKMPVIIDYSHSFFPILFIVLIIRSFIIQPFRVPTGSLEPTVLPNDFIAVNQFIYGLRLPVLNTKIISIREPKIGDIAVFHHPQLGIDYVKRVIGTPGDHVVYKNKVLIINGHEMPQKFLNEALDFEPPNNYIPVDLKEENLNGLKHHIFVQRNGGDTMDFDLIVPPDNYFMMGDNRDNSADSRYWGFVPEKDLMGKAFFIWFSWDSPTHSVRWSRMGTRI